MNGSNVSNQIKIEDVDETVDDSDEDTTPHGLNSTPPTPTNTTVHGAIEQAKPQKPQKLKQVFDTPKNDLIEYDDEKVMNSSVPLPGM